MWVDPVTATLKPWPMDGIGGISFEPKKVLSVGFGFLRLTISILSEGGTVIGSLMWAMISSAKSITGVRYFSAKLKALTVRLNISCTELGDRTMEA